MPDTPDGNWLGIDYGERTVGVAVAHPLTGSARPLEPLKNGGRTHLQAGLERLVREWRPVRIVIGLPLNGDGEETVMSANVRRFARWLGEILPGPEICLHDERLSSEAAASDFADRRGQGRARRRDAGRLDSVAAALILDSWISEHGTA